MHMIKLTQNQNLSDAIHHQLYLEMFSEGGFTF